ncbi:M48 family metallopeptidase [Psychromonas aquimarina]|uniref:M48 family metallopeptidase n=1 Tax=Psychromonas aquimarina TaxID=444919 RepID=UPI0003F4CD98|nr:M48 family metallopeptidase [Psychromonas aquimarina]
MYISGIYLDGKTSRRHKVRLLAVNNSELLSFVKDEEGQANIDSIDSETLFSVEFSQLKISAPLGNTPREISFGDNELFITEDHSGISQLAAVFSQSKSTSLLHKLETNLSFVLLFTFAAAAIVWATFAYGIPKLSETIAYQLPEFAAENSASSMALLDATLFEPSELDESRRQHIEYLFRPYIKAHARLKPKLVFRSGMGANALALPGGEIVFTDELVELTESDDELLAVLFHELGHLEHKHMLRRMLQGSMVSLAVIFITGDVETFDLITGLPTLLVDLSYSREFETEADTYALDQLHGFDLPLDSFILIMQRLENKKEQSRLLKYSKSEFLSTHPTTKQRVEFAEQYKNKLQAH